jgi:hypothetical protein
VSNRQNADAFDDLLGQLVDELAMTPTMPEEPEPEPPLAVPGGTTVGPVPQGPHAGGANVVPVPADYPPPRSSSAGLGIGIAVGIVVLGGVIAGMLILKDGDEEKKNDAAADTEVEAKADDAKTEPPPPAPGAAPPVAGQPVPGQPVPGQPGVAGQPGTPVPGQPGTETAGQPGTADPATAPPTPDPTAAPKKKKTQRRKKPAAKKSKPKTVNPFG